MRALAIVAIVLLSACSKKPEPPRRTEPWLANPSGSAAASPIAARRFHFTGESSVRFSVPSRKAKVGGSAPVSGGELVLEPQQLERSRASVDVDLTKLALDASTLPEGADLGGRPASELMLDWLELGADVATEKREQFARARFELVSIENTSASALLLEPRQKRVRATVVGTLLIHGFRAPVRADVWLEPLSAGQNGAPRLSIRSAAPLVVPLAPHDIGARSASGMSDPLAGARAAEWVGKAARLEVELVAEADPTPSK